MDVTTTCRDIDQLHTVAQTACKLFLAECEKAGVKIFISETYRSQARQNYLYEQGRTRPGLVVTWTKNSNHMGRLAWDIAVSPPASLYDIVTLNKAGAIARKLGITWGGDWPKNIDRPHFEVKTTWKAPAGSVAHDVPKKEDEELKFSSPTVRKAYEKLLESKATQEIVINEGIKAGAFGEIWRTRWENKELAPDDIVGLTVLLALKNKS